MAFVGGIERAAENAYAQAFIFGDFIRRLEHVDAYAIMRFMIESFRIISSDGDDGKNNVPDTVAPDVNIAIKTKPEAKKPSLYKVFLLNDDYTPMEFVVQVLETIFNKSREDATRVMLHVHKRGAGLCGVFTYEIAETKVMQVMQASRSAQHPLQCTMEKE